MLQRTYDFIEQVYNGFNKHRDALLAAGIAFFTFLSIFPLFLLLGVILSYVLDNQQLQQQIIAYVFERVPILTDEVEGTIQGIIRARDSLGILALISLLWSATGLFGSLAMALNIIYGVTETRNIIKLRLMAIIMLLLVLLLLIISFSATSFISLLRSNVELPFLPQQVTSIAWTILSFIVGFTSTLLLFFVIYRYVPNLEQSFRNIWLGTLIAGIAWELTKYGLTLYYSYIGTQGYGFIYGGLASIVITLFWLNISSMLFLIGAEINAAYRQLKTMQHR